MANDKIRTLFYRRVIWFEDAKRNLQSFVDTAHKKLNTTQSRTFKHNDVEIQGLSIQSGKHGSFIHIAAYVPDQSTSLVPTPSKAKSKQTDTEDPPDNYNFMEGDVFIYIVKNNLIICPSGARETVAFSYLQKLLHYGGHSNIAGDFEVEAVANIDKVKLLKKEGVKKIKLNSSLFEASVDYMERKTAKMTMLNSVAKEFMDIFAKDRNKDLQSIEDLENLSVKVEISFDSRKKGGKLGRERIEKAAGKLVNEDEGFSIVTGDGKTLTPEEVRISQKIKLTSHGNSVFRTDVLSSAEGYYEELKEAGVLGK